MTHGLTRDPMTSSALISEIRPEVMTSSHLEDLADLHYRMLSWSFNGRLGKQHIRDLYTALLESKSLFGYVVYHEKRLMGFVTATTDLRETRSCVVKAYHGKMGRLLLLLLKSPKTALTIAESWFLVPRIFRAYGCRAEWLTMLTDTAHFFLTPYISLRLMECLDEHYRRSGVRVYMAQGVKNNPKAMRFYEKLKWKIVRSLFVHHVYYFETSNDAKLGAQRPPL